MAAFKDKKNGSWYVQFRYTDWRGECQQKLKRGFATKKGLHGVKMFHYKRLAAAGYFGIRSYYESLRVCG